MPHNNVKANEGDFISCHEKHSISTELHIHKCHFDITQYSRDLYESLRIDCPAEIQASILKRQAEFLAGRVAARSALSAIGSPRQDIPIGENRAPVLPSSVLASISHTRNVAVCAASNRNNFDYLGIDLEDWICEAVAAEIIDIVLNEQEQQTLFRAGLTKSQSATIALSIKESVFKALHPHTREYFGFECAEIFQYSALTKNAQIRIDTSQATQKNIIEDFTCMIETSESSVLTLVAGNFTKKNKIPPIIKRDQLT